jgi:hypothetical protein
MRANRYQLNDRYIGHLKPRTGPYVVWDTRQFGLSILVRPTGHKAFYCVYTFGGHRQCRRD